MAIRPQPDRHFLFVYNFETVAGFFRLYIWTHISRIQKFWVQILTFFSKGEKAMKKFLLILVAIIIFGCKGNLISEPGSPPPAVSPTPAPPVPSATVSPTAGPSPAQKSVTPKPKQSPPASQTRRNTAPQNQVAKAAERRATVAVKQSTATTKQCECEKQTVAKKSAAVLPRRANPERARLPQEQRAILPAQLSQQWFRLYCREVYDPESGYFVFECCPWQSRTRARLP